MTSFQFGVLCGLITLHCFVMWMMLHILHMRLWEVYKQDGRLHDQLKLFLLDLFGALNEDEPDMAAPDAVTLETVSMTSPTAPRNAPSIPPVE